MRGVLGLVWFAAAARNIPWAFSENCALSNQESKDGARAQAQADGLPRVLHNTYVAGPTRGGAMFVRQYWRLAATLLRIFWFGRPMMFTIFSALLSSSGRAKWKRVPPNHTRMASPSIHMSLWNSLWSPVAGRCLPWGWRPADAPVCQMCPHPGVGKVHLADMKEQ